MGSEAGLSFSQSALIPGLETLSFSPPVPCSHLHFSLLALAADSPTSARNLHKSNLSVHFIWITAVPGLSALSLPPPSPTSVSSHSKLTRNTSLDTRLFPSNESNGTLPTMLRSSTWSACVATVALFASAATLSNAQAAASGSSVAMSSSASISATATIPATPSATPTVAPYLASCPAELELQISICLDTVARDGAVLPCNPDDWWCNCNNWQGIISCYQPCPNLQDQLDIDWNQQNCQGQHGYANFFGGNTTDFYLGSNITTTGSNGYTRSYYSE